VVGSCEVDVASIASISGEPNSRQLELLLKGSSSNSLRGTELKLSLQVTTSGLNTDNDSTSSPRSLGRRSSQSYSNVPSEASSPLSSNTPLESRSPSLIGERSLPALPRVPTSDERRFSLFSKTVNSKTSPNELSKYPSNSSSTQSMNNESDSATGQEATETTKSPQTKRSSRANSLFGSLKNKVEAHGRRQTPQGEDDKMNISMSPKSPQDSPSPGLQRSFSQLSYSGESKMDDIDTLREQLGKEREHIKSLEEELKRRDEQMRLNKASYQEELQQLTSLLFQERNKLSVVEEQRKKLQQELSSMREKNSSPKETQADSSSSVSTLYEENERLKRENRELRDKLNSLPEYPWTNGSPVNVQVAPLLENNQKYGKHDG
jgi:FtsZ-binding cell division protein ZapB